MVTNLSSRRENRRPLTPTEIHISEASEMNNPGTVRSNRIYNARKCIGRLTEVMTSRSAERSKFTFIAFKSSLGASYVMHTSSAKHMKGIPD